MCKLLYTIVCLRLIVCHLFCVYCCTSLYVVDSSYVMCVYWYTSLYVVNLLLLSSSPAVVSNTYPVFIEPAITRIPSGFSGYIWLDTKIVLKKTYCMSYVYPIQHCIQFKFVLSLLGQTPHFIPFVFSNIHSHTPFFQPTLSIS